MGISLNLSKAYGSINHKYLLQKFERWDTRKVSRPTDTLILHPVKKKEQVFLKAMGASVLEYEPTIPTRYMVGTQNGVVLLCSRRGKIPQEKFVYRYDAHLGSVVSLQRNPQFVKNFLTVGDWSAKIWSEDCRESAIMWTVDHKTVLTGGAWSPTRLSVFFTTRSDGILNVWDILNQQKQATLNVKVCDAPLKCLRVHEGGRIVAVGDEKGSIYLIEISRNLTTSNKNDKMLLTAMFERESKREKILEARNKELRLRERDLYANSQQDKSDKVFDIDLFDDPLVKKAEKEFYEVVKQRRIEMCGGCKSDVETSETAKPPQILPEVELENHEEKAPKNTENNDKESEIQENGEMKVILENQNVEKKVGTCESNSEDEKQ